MTASEYQVAAKAALEQHFSDVQLEWSVVKHATDAFSRDVDRYAPRIDIAVGPFNTARGRDSRISGALLPGAMRALFDKRTPNPNPRCLLAIEVVWSGSSKHILGDILNAGALGMYGVVVGSDALMPKIQRISKYVELLGELEKLPWLFRNVAVLSTQEFEAVLTTARR